MSQRMIYHWRHGWIPLDVAAALSKAHGSKTGAARIMAQRGIDGHTAVDAPPRQHKRFQVQRLDQSLIDRGIAGGSKFVVRDNSEGGRGNVARHQNGHLAYFKGHAEAQRHADTWNTQHETGKAMDYEEGYRREMGQVDANAARQYQAGMAGISGQLQQMHQQALRRKAAARVAAKKATPNPVGKDFRSMTSAEKIRAAEIMHGTGSKQHQAAKKKFGGK